MRQEGGELTLEITDATDRMVPLKVAHPWKQDGHIRATKELNAEWNEAVERSQERQDEDSDSQESTPPNAS